MAHRRDPGVPLGRLLWLVPIGVLSWTFLEYVLHRFVLHARGLDFTGHGVHHDEPKDPDKILVQPLLGLLASLPVFAILLALTPGVFAAAAVMTGIWTGFLYYESVHYRIHVSTKNSPLLQWQRRSHFHHHFTDSGRCFGVTSPVWDRIAGTRRLRKNKIAAAARCVGKKSPPSRGVARRAGEVQKGLSRASAPTCQNSSAPYRIILLKENGEESFGLMELQPRR